MVACCMQLKMIDSSEKDLANIQIHGFTQEDIDIYSSTQGLLIKVREGRIATKKEKNRK